VRAPLPDFVVEQLKSLPGLYWFHDDQGGQSETMLENAAERLKESSRGREYSEEQDITH